MPTPSIHAFAEKVALVVNGADAVGRAVALQLALQGAFVICSFEKASENDKKTLDELRSLGTLAHSLEFVSAEKLIDEVENIFGRLDLLVNCVNPSADAVSGIEMTTRASLHLLSARPKGLIVNVISENQTAYFVENLPAHCRQNCVIAKPKTSVAEHELFVSSNYDDIARVVLFFLSNESKALNRQILTAE